MAARSDGRLVEALRASGIEAPFTHQAAAYAAAAGGRNVVVVTPTASGKTLCYNLPVLDAIAKDDAARALYLFPTKALAADQLVAVRAIAEAAGIGLKSHTYDGDTPPNVRAWCARPGRSSSPTRTCSMRRSFRTTRSGSSCSRTCATSSSTSSIRTCGLFGSHVANVIRRLHRICAHYGANPTFICASATIANPRELAERVLEAPVELVDDNGAPWSRRHVLVINPPVANEELGIRSSALLTGSTSPSGSSAAACRRSPSPARGRRSRS